MTDEHKLAMTSGEAHASASHKKPTRLTPEQIADMTAQERQDLITELEASLEELRRPVPQPYPKWVEIDGVSQVVESEDEEERKTKAAADFHKNEKKDKKADEGDATNRRR